VTAPVPAGTASPSAVGLLGAAGTAATSSAGAANGAGGDFLSLVLQLLGAPAATPGSGEPSTESPAGSVADAPPAPGSGEPATVPGPGKVVDAPPAQDPAAVVDPALAALLAGLTAGTAIPTAPASAGPTGTTPAGSAQPGTVTAPGATAAKSPATSSGAAATAQADRTVASDAAAPAAAPATPTNLTATGPAPTVAATAGPATATAPAPVAHQVFDRVVEAIRVSDAGPGPTRVTVRLQPESLGEVRVVMSVRDGALQVSLAGGQPAHHSLLEGAPELRRLLEAAGTPDVRVVVRDLARGASVPLVSAPATTSAVAATQQAQQGQASLDLGAGGSQQQGQQGQQLAAGAGQQGHPSDRRAAQPGAGDPIDIPGTATSPRRTDPVTRTRSAGVDVTM